MTEHRWIDVPLTITDKIGQWAIWAGTRFVVVSPLLLASSVECISGIINKLAKQFKHTYTKILIVYDALPYGGMEGSKLIQTEARIIHQSIEPITDIFAEIDGKQVMVLGEMGTGKSTLAQYLAYTVGGQIKVYEPEGTPTDWKGLEVIGKGEDWSAIDAALADDLDDLSNQMKLRTEHGDGSLEGTEKCIIAEEFPEIVSKCENSGEWLERHARRGRKARRFLVLLSQYDRVSAWGMEGKSDLLDCFRRIRLGKKAIAHAKSLKNDALVEWLKADRSRALIDDEPLILPAYREMKAAIARPQLSYQATIPQPAQLMLEATGESQFQPISQEFEPTLEGILKAIEAGKSDDWITKHVLGTPGGSTYSRNKARVAAIRSIP